MAGISHHTQTRSQDTASFFFGKVRFSDSKRIFCCNSVSKQELGNEAKFTQVAAVPYRKTNPAKVGVF